MCVYIHNGRNLDFRLLSETDLDFMHFIYYMALRRFCTLLDLQFLIYNTGLLKPTVLKSCCED